VVEVYQVVEEEEVNCEYGDGKIKEKMKTMNKKKPRLSKPGFNLSYGMLVYLFQSGHCPTESLANLTPHAKPRGVADLMFFVFRDLPPNFRCCGEYL